MTIRTAPPGFALFLALICSAFPAVAADVNLGEGTSIKASSTFGNSKAAAVADGVVSDESRWLAASGDTAPWVELTFPKPVNAQYENIIDVLRGRVPQML
jgi:hypothetical protein